MILIKNVNINIDADFSDCKALVCKYTQLNESEVRSASLYKKSVDARKKSNIVFCCSFLADVKNEAAVVKRVKNAEVFTKKEYEWQKCKSEVRPVVIGFGPAGMFAALTLARAGLKPICFERGRDVDSRVKYVESFWNGGKLNPNSNIQFGEGGAGTFSDGKLNTGIKDVRCRTVLEQFVLFGAQPKILYEAKPHIGTDVLREVVKNIRREIIALGGEVFFEHTLEGIVTNDKKLIEITVNGKHYKCSHLVLSTGHSARDTFKMLKESGLELERKSFAIGSRIEHLQEDINKAMYGRFFDHEALGAADYKLVTHLESGHAVYSFCMCPGGFVVNASSEEGHIAVNGMSNSGRDGKNANSALLVEIKPTDLEGDDVLEGIKLQRDIEKTAYDIGDGAVPCCSVGELLGTKGKGRVSPTVLPKTVRADIYKVLPGFVATSIKNSILEFDKKISGFASADALLTFPETRSSSPVRVVRDKSYQATRALGLFPCGEGAGYAGGIMSAAVDGIRVGEAVINSLK